MKRISDTDEEAGPDRDSGVRREPAPERPPCRPPAGREAPGEARAELIPASLPTSRAARKAATRDRILTAARALFTERTYADVTLRDVCRASGVSLGGLHGHVSDKADLWRAAMGCEPPLDGDLVRAAAEILDMLRRLRAARPADRDEAPDRAAAWRRVDAVLALFDAETQNPERPGI